MTFKTDQILSKAQKPLTYIACEDNAVFKQQALFNFCLIYPDLYELGIGSLGMNILYSTLNAQQDIWAQRAYMPDLDVQELLQQEKLSLFSLEEARPLNKFDILGFSLPHELCYSNVLKILELSMIPIKSADRNGSHPLIIAGGHAAFNPVPLSPFIDAFVIGEGEEATLEMVDGVRVSGLGSRNEKLEALSKIEGVWVPRIQQLTTNNQQLVTKRIIKDLNSVKHTPLVPTSKGEKRLVVELMRGCTKGCRFCQAGFVCRPIREKEVSSAYNEAVCGVQQEGLSQVSLLSLSTSDYSQIEPLSTSLANALSPKNISISLPSLRIDDFSTGILTQIGSVKKTGLTFAIEAGSQRLRDLINKNLSEEQIIETLTGVFQKGWNKVKLYFMIGLPTETQQDLEETVELVYKIVRLAKANLPKGLQKRLEVIVNVSNYVPKPHTPFQWVAQDDLEKTQAKHRFLMDEIRGPALKLKWHNAKQSMVEGILARGDHRISEVIEKAYQSGAIFDNFSEHFNFEIWDKALKETGLKWEDYQQQRQLDEDLPWDFVDCGISKSFLKEEYFKGLKGESTADCRSAKCPQCGLCDKQIKNRFSSELKDNKEANVILNEVKNLDPSAVGLKDDTLLNSSLSPTSDSRLLTPQKYRLFVKREGQFKYLSHLEWTNLLQKRLRQADISLVSKGKYNPRPKLSYSAALPVGSNILEQFVDFRINGEESIDELESKLKKAFSRGVVFMQLQSLN